MSKFVTADAKTRKWVLSNPSVSHSKAMNGSSWPLVPGNKTGIVSNAVSKALAASWRTVTLPWYLTLKWLSWCAAVIIHFFTLLGATPQGYVPLPKVQELNSIIEHMHTREDLYRKTIRELQDSVDSKDSDKKRALKRLKHTRAEVELLQQQLAELQEEYFRNTGEAAERAAAMAAVAAAGAVGDTPAAKPPHPPGMFATSPPSRVALHATMALLCAMVWWFYQQPSHALQRKLILTVLFPVLWSYLHMLLSHRRMVSHPLLLYSVSWALIGFVGGYKLTQAT